MVAGGLLGETVCEKTKTRFRELLTAGRADQVEHELQPGLEFAVQVRARASITARPCAG